MSVESLAAISSIVTSIVVVVSAFAAVRQLRHLRASNEVVALQNIINRYERQEIIESTYFIRAELADKLRDPAFLEGLGSPISGEARAMMPALNYWESVGSLVLSGAISAESIMQGFSWPALVTWRSAAPAIAILRRTQDPSVCENFEHLAAFAMRWLDRHHRTKSRLLRMPPPASAEPRTEEKALHPSEID